MNKEINRFNIRVYFICFDDERKKVLLADEIIREKKWTKFPGGGLEFGEGTLDCARREALEELGQEVEIIRHFYTADFFIQSAFHDSQQIISIYYEVLLKEEQRFRSTPVRFDFIEGKEGEESFRWADLSALNIDDFELPADRKVVELLIQKSNT